MRSLALVAFIPVAVMTAAPYATANPFSTTQIQFNGLMRLSAESLYPVLAVRDDEPINYDNIAKSIQALYDTGNFSDVQVRQIGNQIIFDVIERPVIAGITFEGNKMIPKESLQEGLKKIGLVSGQVLKQATLEQVINELKQQYNYQGYYNSQIEVVETKLDNNRVALKLLFKEGKPAKIIDIKVIGNHHFSDKDIKDALKMKETSWVNVLSKSDRYGREKLTTGLKNLTAMYQNAGFVRFTIQDAILNINPEKDQIYIEISLDEGEKYQFGQVGFLGDSKYPIEKLQQQVTFKAGKQFSQELVTETATNIANLFGNDGYYFAEIRPIPEIDDDNKIVNINYVIDPVRPVYVRRINFVGNTKTQDHVLRREMRQLEGALTSHEKIELSKIRLMRTGYFKNVEMDIQPVANTPDQVDIQVKVEEQPSGSSTIAVGYSQGGGLTFQAGLSQNNFMGTGNKVNIQLSRSQTLDNYRLGYVNPYFTADGISQGANIYYRKTKYDPKNISNYTMDSMGGSLNFSYPVDETKSVSAGFSFDRTKILAGTSLAIANFKQLKDYGKLNLIGDNNFDAKFNTASVNVGWNMSNLDKGVFPTKGMSHDVDLNLAFGDVNYQKVMYQGNYYRPVYKGSVLRAYTKLGYGRNLPFWENFFAGGIGSVRGYDNYSLGPRSPRYSMVANGRQDDYPEHIGGNALAQVGAELILPMPSKADWTAQLRPVLFVEGAQVFDTTGKHKQTVTNNSSVKLVSNHDQDMRFSAGVGLTWITPIGPISLSYAKPLNSKAGDATDNIQFEVGRLF